MDVMLFSGVSVCMYCTYIYNMVGMIAINYNTSVYMMLLPS